jgi:hypothetical protein
VFSEAKRAGLADFGDDGPGFGPDLVNELVVAPLLNPIKPELATSGSHGQHRLAPGPWDFFHGFEGYAIE